MMQCYRIRRHGLGYWFLEMDLADPAAAVRVSFNPAHMPYSNEMPFTTEDVGGTRESVMNFLYRRTRGPAAYCPQCLSIRYFLLSTPPTPN